MFPFLFDERLITKLYLQANETVSNDLLNQVLHIVQHYVSSLEIASQASSTSSSSSQHHLQQLDYLPLSNNDIYTHSFVMSHLHFLQHECALLFGTMHQTFHTEQFRQTFQQLLAIVQRNNNINSSSSSGGGSGGGKNATVVIVDTSFIDSHVCITIIQLMMIEKALGTKTNMDFCCSTNTT